MTPSDLFEPKAVVDQMDEDPTARELGIGPEIEPIDTSGLDPAALATLPQSALVAAVLRAMTEREHRPAIFATHVQDPIEDWDMEQPVEVPSRAGGRR